MVDGIAVTEPLPLSLRFSCIVCLLARQGRNPVSASELQSLPLESASKKPHKIGPAFNRIFAGADMKGLTRFSKRLGSAIVSFLCCGAVSLAQQSPAESQPIDRFSGRPRAVILSDIGNEPDDQMSLVRLLLYSNELDIEALIASTSVWQSSASHPETMHALIEAYGQVRTNLLLHAKGWPTAEDLDSRVFAGQAAYGLRATGQGKSSAGSEALLRVMKKEDSRPLWICVWGGANTLAQALMDLRATNSGEETARVVARLRVYSISDQDDAGPWIRSEFPALFYVVMPSSQNGEEYYYATWTGISGDVYYRNGAGADTTLVTNEWLDRNIRAKSPLGKMYPRFMFIMEGDTPSYLGLLNNGLQSYRRPDWGGWGGRYVYRQPRGETHAIWTQGGDLFTRVTSQDAVKGTDGQEHVSDQATIWRWREAYQNEFAARMDWTVKEFAHANHNPELVVNGVEGKGILELAATEGETITLDAKGSSDPDGQAIHYHWWVYREAGLNASHGADLSITDEHEQRATAHIKSACTPDWLPLRPCRGDGTVHVILEGTDEGTPRLTSYRRIVLKIHPKPQGLKPPADPARK